MKICSVACAYQSELDRPYPPPQPSYEANLTQCTLSLPALLPLQFLGIHGPALLLDLPPPLYRPELEPYMAALMRHCLEDPATLQVRAEGRG